MKRSVFFLFLAIASPALGSDWHPACSRSPWMRAYLEHMRLKPCQSITQDEMHEVRVPSRGDIETLRVNKLLGKEEAITIASRDFEDLNTSGIETLNLARSRIEAIEPGALSVFRTPFEIYLEDNLIRELPADFIAPGTMVSLVRLKRNPLKSIRANAIRGAPMLVALDFEGSEVELVETDAFLNLPLLKWIDFADNRLNEIGPQTVRNCPNLAWIDYERNRIETIRSHAFSSLPGLIWLGFESNKIGKIENQAFERLVGLTGLDFKGNELEEIQPGPFYLLPSLRWIDYGMNRIRRIHSGAFAVATDLKELDFTAQKNGVRIHADRGAFRNHRNLTLKFSSTRSLDRSTRLRLRALTLFHRIKEIKWIDTPETL